MFVFNRKKIAFLAALLAAGSLYASTFFSGYAGGKLNFNWKGISASAGAYNRYNPI